MVDRYNVESVEIAGQPIDVTVQNGISRRDYFAAMAMQGLLAGDEIPDVVKRSVIFADALIAVLDKGVPL